MPVTPQPYFWSCRGWASPILSRSPDDGRLAAGGYRRDHLRALARRVEVDAKEVRIMGWKSELLRTLAAASSAKTADFGVPSFGVPSFVPRWRARHDSNV